MNELAWRRLEDRLVQAHAAAEPPLRPALWRGVEAKLVARPRRRGAWLALAVVAVAASVAVWFLPADRPALAPPAPVVEPVVAPVPPPVPVPAAPSIVLNQVLETRAARTVVIAADAGRIEVEPCRGRFVNVTVLDSPHRTLALVERGRRVDVELDGGAVLAGGVAHVLVPADTHLIITTKSGPVLVRGLGGPLEIDAQSGEVQVDTAPRIDPAVTIKTETGAITWRGRCGRGCRVAATSRTGDITLRAPDRSAFTRGAARADSAGHVHLEELICSDPRCASQPLSWRQAAAAGHP
jgi:hypothetical protein